MRRGNLAASLAVAVTLILTFAAGGPASAAQPSTPDASVALNSPASSGALLTVTAHSDAEGADHASLVYRNGNVVLNGLDLHRLWVPGLGDHDHAALAEEADHSCSDSEPAIVMVRGLSTQRGVGQVQVWIDVRPGHEDTSMVRVRVRAKTDCGGHDDTGHVSGAASGDHDTGHVFGADDGGHGAWTHDSGWIPLHVVNVQQRS